MAQSQLQQMLEANVVLLNELAESPELSFHDLTSGLGFQKIIFSRRAWESQGQKGFHTPAVLGCVRSQFVCVNSHFERMFICKSLILSTRRFYIVDVV